MKVLNVSLDPHILNPESVVAFRARSYGQITSEYLVIVPSPAKMRVPLSDNVVVFGTGGKLKLIRLFNTIGLIISVVREKQIEVITVQDPYFLGFVCWCVAKYYHIGLEMQVLGLEKLSWIRTALAKFTLKRASVVRALSPRLYERLHKEYLIPYEKMRIVTIYVDVKKLGLSTFALNVHQQKEFDEILQNFKVLYKGRINFLTVARLVPIKNFSLQLQAVERLKENYPQILLHIVGGGPEEAVLRAEIKQRGLEDFVILHGPQYGLSLGVFYVASDCFLLTSNYEGWGMVIVEALSASLPVIMTAVGCADELVKNGESGLVIPVNDLEALVEAMKKITTDSTFRSQLASGAVKALATLPDLDTVLTQYRQSWEVANKNRL